MSEKLKEQLVDAALVLGSLALAVLIACAFPRATFGASLCPGETVTITFSGWTSSSDICDATEYRTIDDIESGVTYRVVGSSYTTEPITPEVKLFRLDVVAVTVDADCGEITSETVLESEVYARISRPTLTGNVQGVINRGP